MNNLQIVCPDIDNMDIVEILKYADSNDYVPSVQVRTNIVKLLYEIYDFKLEPDLLLALVDEGDKQLFLAPAGGGKTTTLNIKLILEKIYRKSSINPGKNITGTNILCLLYNAANVEDFKNRHSYLVNELKSSGVKGIDHLDNSLKVCTIHSFCLEWLEEYKAEAGLVGYDLENGEEGRVSLMTTAVQRRIKKGNYDVVPEEVNIKDLLLLYNYARESRIDYNDMEEIDKFVDLQLPLELVIETFDAYDAVKKRKRKMDYTDLLTKFHELISTNPKVKERIKSRFEFVTADEVQDLTTLMMDIIIELASDKPLIMIGDDDQCIYTFRGANPNNILNFHEHFPDGRAFLLKTNRRCPSNVIDISNSIIRRNKYRYDKSIRAVNEDGIIEFKGMRDSRGQLLSVINMLKDLTDKEKENTCICYRNKSSSTRLVDLLVEQGIHFHVLSGSRPFTYNLFKSTADVLKAISVGNNKRLLYNLHKMLPIKKNDMAEALGLDPITLKPDNDSNVMSIFNLSFPTMVNNEKFNRAWDFVIDLANTIDSKPMNEYIAYVISFIKYYYWDGVVKYLKIDPEEDVEQTKSILKFFDVNKTFVERYSEYESIKRITDRDQNTKSGVCLSTFHSLKGLEFDNVIIIDLAESIFPNTVYIESKPYSPEQIRILKETEIRLFYVALTRTKKKLTLCYSQADPSIFVSMLLDYQKETTMARQVIHSNTNKLIDLDVTSFSNENSDDDLSSTLIEETGTVDLDDDDDDDIVVSKPKGKITIEEDGEVVSVEEIKKKEKIEGNVVKNEDEIVPINNFKSIIKKRFFN